MRSIRVSLFRGWTSEKSGTEHEFASPGGKHRVLLLAILAISVVLVIAPITNGEALGSWGTQTAYPLNIYSQSCVIYSGYIYCVGGFEQYVGQVNNVYSASVSSGSVGTWGATTAYPAIMDDFSCAVDSSIGYIFCVAGNSGSNGLSSAVYYATLSSGTVGTWQSTTAYPAATWLHSCVIYGGYIYCVDGVANGSYPASVYSATVSSSGVGTWQSQASYPISVAQPSCVTYSADIYCIGGQTGVGVDESQVYYATLSSGTVGTWQETTDYGGTTTTDGSGGVGTYGHSCTVSTGYVYCVGGVTASASGGTNAVYYSKLSASGVGAWTLSSASYPQALTATSCAADSGYLYCVGGDASNTPVTYSYSSQIAAPVPDLPYGVIPILLAIPALYLLITRRQGGRGTTGSLKSGK